MLSTTAASVAPITASANAHHKTSTHKVKKHHVVITKNKDVYHLKNGDVVKFGTKKFGDNEMPWVYTLKRGHRKTKTPRRILRVPISEKHPSHVVKKHVTKKHTKKSKSFVSDFKSAIKRFAKKQVKEEKARKARAAKRRAQVNRDLKKHWYTRWLA